MTPTQPDNSRNTMIFLVCVLGLFTAYQYLVIQPQAKRAQALAAKAAAQAKTAAPTASDANPAPVLLSRDQALRADPRVKIETPATPDHIGGLTGSINLTGGLIDDLSLQAYHQTTNPKSEPVELFRPVRADHAYFAQTGWRGDEGASANMPGPTTPWHVVSGGTLSPGHPVVLAFDAVDGLSFRRTFAVDDHFMFTVTDTVTNTGPRPAGLWPFAAVERHGLPAFSTTPGFEGAIGVFPKDGAAPDKLLGYRDWQKKTVEKKKQDDKRKAEDAAFRPVPRWTQAESATGGWYGLTDKYWMGAVIPDDQKLPVDVSFIGDYRADPEIYRAAFSEPKRVLKPGESTTNVVHVFAGAKSNQVLDAYATSLKIPNFRLAIDWGRLFFLTQPLFALLKWFYGFVGNYGVAILMLTVVVRGAMFPLALQSYSSMSKMKKVQPQLEELKKKFAGDQAKQQQEMMALYQREKINPVAGCLPMLLTIPVFFALNNMLSVTIELRHAPFFGWIHDLSAPDPTTFLNLFGAIPWDPAHTPLIGGLLNDYLHIGVWPLLYGVTTFLQMQMQPSPSTDPTQKMIMQFFPLVFMVFIGKLAVGLVIYYVWSNTITILQQWFMMRRNGVENPIDATIQRVRDRISAPRKVGG